MSGRANDHRAEGHWLRFLRVATYLSQEEGMEFYKVWWFTVKAKARRGRQVGGIVRWDNYSFTQCDGCIDTCKAIHAIWCNAIDAIQCYMIAECNAVQNYIIHDLTLYVIFQHTFFRANDILIWITMFHSWQMIGRWTWLLSLPLFLSDDCRTNASHYRNKSKSLSEQIQVIIKTNTSHYRMNVETFRHGRPHHAIG